jgi:hypothetical protein
MRDAKAYKSDVTKTSRVSLRGDQDVRPDQAIATSKDHQREAILGWCDKLASTPAVGFTLDWRFATSNAIFQAFSPILDKLVENNKQTFTMERQEVFNVTFTTNDGFQYAIEPSKIAVTFHHRLKVKQISGGPPTMELLSSPLPFSQLLPDVESKLIEAALLLPGANTSTVTRIGIVSTTFVAEDEVPPGIEPEDREQLPTLRFDWQRTFVSGRPLTHESLRDITASAEIASLKYLEELAEGSQFDEDIIRSST